MAKFGIKVQWDDGVETWMMGFPEYLDSETKPMTYSSRFQAEDAAKNMRLKNYRVEEIE